MLKQVLLKNRLVWFISVVFIGLTVLVTLPNPRQWMEGFFMALPLYFINITFAAKLKTRLSPVEYRFYLINIGFFLGIMLSLLLSYTNSDVRGWWLLGLYVSFIYGLVFSLCYTTISYFSKLNNRFYDVVFCVVLVLGLVAMQVLVVYFKIYDIATISSDYFLLGALLLFHLVFNLFYNMLIEYKGYHQK